MERQTETDRQIDKTTFSNNALADVDRCALGWSHHSIFRGVSKDGLIYARTTAQRVIMSRNDVQRCDNKRVTVQWTYRPCLLLSQRSRRGHIV